MNGIKLIGRRVSLKEYRDGRYQTYGPRTNGTILEACWTEGTYPRIRVAIETDQGLIEYRELDHDIVTFYPENGQGD